MGNRIQDLHGGNTMSNKLDQIRNKLKKMDNPEKGKGGGQLNKTIYPFWNMSNGEEVVLRFLPDGDEDNTFFWVERQLIKIPFDGIKGVDENKAVTIQVPCIEMWGETCPIHTELRQWFKSPDLEDTARTYWKKRSYLFQGFVRKDPLNESDDQLPENPIRRFIIGPQIYKIIKNSLADETELEELPTDYELGLDFKLRKEKQGQYADYSTSGWARKESSLNEEELEAIEKHGLFNLSDFLPTKPDQEHLDAIVEMWEASVNGDLYDPERWANYYKPFGVDLSAFEGNEGSQKPASSSKTEAAKSIAERVKSQSADDSLDDSDDDSSGEESTSKSGSDASAILDKIRKKNAS